MKNLALEFVKVTEAAASASAQFIGRGDSVQADQVAVNAMREAFNSVDIDGVIVIGEGERDQAPMLFIGEKVGQRKKGSPQLDIAVDPLEGTSICANAGYGALSVLAVALRGHLLHAPDTYMDKIAVGPIATDVIDITKSPTENIQAVAEVQGKSVDHIRVVILDRPRHKDLIAEVRKTGATVQLIGDGDVSAAIMTAQSCGVDLLLGIGGAPEGVLAATALKCLGGNFQGQLKYRNAQERERTIAMGLKDPDQILKLDDLASGDVMFVATGVTHGPLLEGVIFADHQYLTMSSMIIDSDSTRYLLTTRQV